MNLVLFITKYYLLFSKLCSCLEGFTKAPSLLFATAASFNGLKCLTNGSSRSLDVIEVLVVLEDS